MNSPDVEQLILRHTGFTNFYSAYRNSVRGWVEDNFETLADLYGRAYSASGLDDRRQLVYPATKEAAEYIDVFGGFDSHK